MNIKRLAYETTPAVVRRPAATTTASVPAAAAGGNLPKPPAPPPVPGGISADVLARRIDEFLSSRGYRPAPAGAPPAAAQVLPPKQDLPPQGGSYKTEEKAPQAGTAEKPADFVCEDDVRQALKQNRKIVIGERSIVTPAARDLGEQHRLFIQASWPR